MRLSILAALAGAAAVAAAAPAAAQARRAASMTGTVHSEAQAPIEAAEIRVVAESLEARTSASGRYQLDGIPPGQYMVQVRRLGYSPLYFAVTLKAGEQREVDVELARLPTQLSAVRVKERSGYGLRDANRLRDFAWRRRSTATSARFLTRDDLAQRHRGSGTLFNALRTEWPFTICATTGAPIAGSLGTTGAYPGRRGCRVAVSVDGGIPMSGETVVDYPLGLVEALEIYRGGIGTPVEFQIGPARSADVIVVVWTGVDTDWR